MKTLRIIELPTFQPETGRVNVVVETPKGSRNKYKFDEATGHWVLNKILPEGLSFPYDFGFIPSTRGEDGDPIDVLLINSQGSFAGCVVGTRLIGVLEAEQTQHGETVRNDRLLAVVETQYNPPEFQSLDEFGEQHVAEIEQFFISYNLSEGREFKPVGRGDAEQAERLLLNAMIGKQPRRRTKSKSHRRLSK